MRGIQRRHHHRQGAQRHDPHRLFCGHQGQRRLHSLQVGGGLPAGVRPKVSGPTTSLNLTGTPTIAATYSFAVKVTGCGGRVSQVSYKVVIQATANHVVDLNWKPSTSADVIGYNVYRGPDGATWKKINASLTASTLYIDFTVANSTTYYYATTAVDIYGHESSKSTSAKAVIP
jgi:hypothetical protein